MHNINVSRLEKDGEQNPNLPSPRNHICMVTEPALKTARDPTLKRPKASTPAYRRQRAPVVLANRPMKQSFPIPNLEIVF